MIAKFTAGLAAVWLATGSVAALAQDAVEETEQAEAQRQLEQAQRELEEAAREVARLSAQVHGPMLHEFRRVHVGAPDRAMLGVNIGRAEPGTEGVRVVSVSPGGPAAEAGVATGDLIVAINGKRVGSGRDLVGNMRDVEPGQKVGVELLRDGDRKEVFILARPAGELLAMNHGGIPAPGVPGQPRPPHFLVGPWGDAEFVPMTPELGRYFGTDRGLLVVRKPTALGPSLEEGDVILSIGGREPQNPGHALRILGSYQPGEAVDLKVLRQRKERNVQLTVPEPGSWPGRPLAEPGPPPPPR